MCVLFVRVFAFLPNRFLPASTRFFRSFPSGPAASVRFPSSGLFSSAPFVRVSSSTGSVLLFHYRKITDFSLCCRHARPCRPIPVPLLSARSRRFCPFSFRAVSPSRRRYADFLSSGEICRLFRSETRRVRLPVRTDSAPVWLLGPAALLCSPSFVLPSASRSVVRSCRFCLSCRLHCRPACPFSVRSFFRGKTRS